MIMTVKRIHPDEMPAPDALINYSGGAVAPAMFHYAPTEAPDSVFRDIAREHGFEIKTRHMSAEDPLYEEYAQGSDKVIWKWQPEIPDGWQLGGKHDTEDGPCAYFLRQIKAEQS